MLMGLERALQDWIKMTESLKHGLKVFLEGGAHALAHDF